MKNWRQALCYAIAFCLAIVIGCSYARREAKKTSVAEQDAMVEGYRKRAVKTIDQVVARIDEEPPPAVQSSSLRTFAFAEDKFQIGFPGKPNVHKYATATEYFVATEEEVGYSVVVTRLPIGIAAKEADAFLRSMLHSKMSALAGVAGAKLIRSTGCRVDGAPALAYEYECEGAGRVVLRMAINVLVASRVYGISVVCAKEHREQSRYDKFVGSFMYTGQEEF